LTVSGSTNSLQHQINVSADEINKRKLLFSVVDRKLEEKEGKLCECLEEICLLKESLLVSSAAKEDLLFLCKERVMEVTNMADERTRMYAERALLEHEELITRFSKV
jgi:hypothetical protein